MTSQKNPKILHRIYFDNYAPFHDPFDHFLESWHREMPDYTVMKWNATNLNVDMNDWTKAAAQDRAPVFLAEYFRWHVLAEYGGLYLDADCEILDGKVLSNLLDELYSQDEYDVFFGVEERANGHPTAQTVAAKKGADLVLYMKDLYENRLAPLWQWREQRGLIGPQLMSLYFDERGFNQEHNGFFKNLSEPTIFGRAKVYPQTYFSPKFSILGEEINFDEGKTCVYHMFANSNVDFSSNQRLSKARKQALTFSEYREALTKASSFPRFLDPSHFSAASGEFTDDGIVGGDVDGLFLYGPYFALPAGAYVAAPALRSIASSGEVEIRVTQQSGNVVLGQTTVDLASNAVDKAEIPFEVTGDDGKEMEIVIFLKDVEHIEFTGAEIRQLAAIPAKPMVEGRAGSDNDAKSLKILHRVYFGFDGKPDAFQAYLETWREQLPDFRIMHWNASNLPMDINPYVRQLYAEKDHAFLTDFFRWYLLREYGGTYLDADVEVVNGDVYRSLIEDLAADPEVEAFIGIDERGGGWYTAHSMASKPNSDIANFMCDLYANMGSFTIWRKKGFYFWAPQLTSLYFTNRGHNYAGMGTTPWLDQPQVVSKVKIYPQEWFAPLAPSGNPNQPFLLSAYTDNSCICHHFACSWHEADSMYLSHSKERGGQANVLLKDIVAMSRRTSYLANGSEIKTVEGVKTDAGISTTGRSGCLSYGPYTHLEPGRYAMSFVISELKNLGKTEADIAAEYGDAIVMEKRRLELIEDGRLSTEFEVHKPLDAVEFRLHISDDSDFTLEAIVVERLD